MLILLQSLFSTAISQSFHDAGTVVDAALRPVPDWRPITADVAATEIPERVAARPCPLPERSPGRLRRPTLPVRGFGTTYKR